LYSCTIDEVEKLKSEIMEKYAILAELLKTNATIRYKEVLNGMQT
jgi:hypothetical protein